MPANRKSDRGIKKTIVGKTSLIAILIAHTQTDERRYFQVRPLPTHAQIVIAEMPAAAERIARSHRYFEPVAGGMKRSVSEAQSELSGLFVAFHATGLEQPGRRRNRYEKGKTPLSLFAKDCACTAIALPNRQDSNNRIFFITFRINFPFPPFPRLRSLQDRLCSEFCTIFIKSSQ